LITRNNILVRHHIFRMQISLSITKSKILKLLLAHHQWCQTSENQDVSILEQHKIILFMLISRT
jgi:hypothetical protein